MTAVQSHSRLAGYAEFLHEQSHDREWGERHRQRQHYQEGEPFTDGRKVGWVKTEHLLPYREYDRSNPLESYSDSAERIKSIREDLQEGTGWTDPISLSYHHDSHRALVDEGNHRLQAALEAGVSHVPVTVNRVYSPHDHHLALWGRSQVRTQPDRDGYVPGQMHPHEVLPDEMLHESSRRPEGFNNWPPEHLRREHSRPASEPHDAPETSIEDVLHALRPVHQAAKADGDLDSLRLEPTGEDFNPHITQYDVHGHGISVPEEDGWSTQVRFEQSDHPDLNHRIVVTQAHPSPMSGARPFVRDVGRMSYHPETGRVEGIQTHDNFARRGVATGMWNLAKRLHEQHGVVAPAHSENQTPDGAAWAAKTAATHQGSLQVEAGLFGPEWYEKAHDDEIDAHSNADGIRSYMTHHTSPQGHVYRLTHDTARYVTATYLGKGDNRIKTPQIVGRLSYFGGKANDQNNVEGRIYKVFVKPAHRRRGIASAMLDHARAMAAPGDEIQHSDALSDDGRAWSQKKATRAQSSAASGARFMHGPGTRCWVQGCVGNGDQVTGIHKSAAPIPPPLKNPATGGTDWYHGTSFDPHEDEDDEYADEGGTVRPPSETGHGSEESDGRRDEHWNTDLGSHFTSLHQVATHFANKGERSTGTADSRVLTAGLHMANPKHFDSEEEMANHAIDWAHKNGHQWLQGVGANDNKRRRFEQGDYGYSARPGDEDDEHLGEHMDYLHDRIGGSERQINQIDLRGSRAPGVTETDKDQWIAQHPDREAVTSGYVDHLRSMGHDGITYGNSIEKPIGHTCAIAFDDTPIHHRKWTWTNPEAHARQEQLQPRHDSIPGQAEMTVHRHPQDGLSLTATKKKHAVQDSPEGMTFEHSEEQTGGSKWPYRHTLTAKHPEHGAMGTLAYYPPKRKGGKVLVDHLQVAPYFRRMGVGSALMDEMQRRHPGSSINHGDRTDDGKAWWAGYTDGKTVTRGRTAGLDGASLPEGWTHETMQHMSAVGAEGLQSHPAEPMELDWMHNDTPSTAHQGDPSAFGRDVEPAGRYVTQRPQDVEPAEGWSTGSTSFARPLHLDFGGGYDHPTNWKRRLSDAYGGKSGHELSQAVRADGYDGIVTHDGKYGTSEIVDLTGGRKTAAGPGDSLPEGWTHEPGKEGSAIKSFYKHPDTGTMVFFPKHEQYHKSVTPLTDDEEHTFVGHVHHAVQRTGEHDVTFMVDTGHDRYFKSTPKSPQGRAGAYVSTDTPDTVTVNPHFLNHDRAHWQSAAAKVHQHYFTPAAQSVDSRLYTVTHELGHVHDIRNHHTWEESRPGNGRYTKTRLSESSFYGRHKPASSLSGYGATSTAEGYAEAFAHHHLRDEDDSTPTSTVSDEYAERYGWRGNVHDPDNYDFRTSSQKGSH